MSIRLFFTLFFILSLSLFGAGYQNPNSSVNSSALSTAYVANAHGADSSYYNPANMVNNISKDELEISLTYVSLEPIKYDSSDGVYHIKSKKYTTFIPSLHYVSGKLNDKGVRVGFSIVSPAGLCREWSDFPAVASAKKYKLQTLEFNPTLAIPITNKLSFGFGFRYIKALAEAKLDGSMLGPSAYTLNMKGSADAFGYNLALSYQYSDVLNISATYRSNIMLNLQGDADVALAGNPFSTSASLKTPVPASFVLATAYTFQTDTTVEVLYHRTMWSALRETNFEFDNAIVEAALGTPKEKRWHDGITYRVGITQKLGSTTLMAGFAYGENAADEKYVTFSSPESDAYVISCGGRYNVSDNFDIGLALLYTQNKSRTVSQPTNPLGVNGTLSDKKVYSITIGSGFKF